MSEVLKNALKGIAMVEAARERLQDKYHAAMTRFGHAVHRDEAPFIEDCDLCIIERIIDAHKR